MDRNHQIVLVVALIPVVSQFPKIYRYFRRNGLRELKQFVVRQFLKLPKYRKQLEEGDEMIREEMHKFMLSQIKNPIFVMPSHKSQPQEILRMFNERIERDIGKQSSCKLSGAIYNGMKDLWDVSSQAVQKTIATNPLHADMFPGVRQMEAEIVRITIGLYNGDQNCQGLLTSGGTESILLAMLAYRQWGRMRGITNPEVIAPRTAHPAFNKAAHYFCINLISVDEDPITRTVNPRQVEREINGNTVAIVGSTPNFPYGTVDPIQELSKLAIKYGVNLHVDACLGGYVIPFAEEAGYPIQQFDFRLPGVTSISCDAHKYGLTPKGVSIVMFRSNDLRKYCHVSAQSWPGGLYGTANLSGSRPGCLSAGAWVTIMTIGREGYVEYTKRIIEATLQLSKAKVWGLELMGNPQLCVVAFTSKKYNPLILCTMLEEKGWGMSSMHLPNAFHFCVTQANCTSIPQLIKDMQELALYLKDNPTVGEKGAAALYGATAQLPDASYLENIASHYIDAMSALS